MLNKKAQVGETLTWIVATVIIILILGVSIFLSATYLQEGKKAGDVLFQSKDTLASKSLFSYMLTDLEGESVYRQLGTEENLNEVNGEIALEIFRDYYRGDYVKIWLGTRVVGEYGISSPVSNDYFPFREDKSIPSLGLQNLFESINLGENKSASLILTPYKLPELRGYG